jgi:hypothetical protein
MHAHSQLRRLLATGLLLAIGLSARGQTNSWIDGSSKWETTNNWSLGRAPSLSDSADYITNASTKTVTIDATTSGSHPSTLSITNLQLSAPAPSTNTLALNSAGTLTPLHVLDSFIITNGGLLTITNSALQVDGVNGDAFLVEGEMR